MNIATFDRAFLANVNDLSTRLTFGTTGKDDMEEIVGEIREMGNGALRAVSHLTDKRTLNVTAVYVDETTRAKLKEWRGQVVLFRDASGRLMYGVYWAIKPKAYRDGHWDVTFTLNKITYDANVTGTQYPV